MKLSNGKESTLGNYRKLVVDMLGEVLGREPVKYLDMKIKESPKGADEPVLASEQQMIALLGSML